MLSQRQPALTRAADRDKTPRLHDLSDRRVRGEARVI